jgi:toxin YoeB
MEIIFAPKALNDLAHWKSSGNIKIQKKIFALITAISADPFNGIGKPEPLKHEFSGCWSRRINETHRIIYEIGAGSIEILSLKDHYQ